jgi:hypothetical protein
MQIAYGLDTTTNALCRLDIWSDEALRSNLILTLGVLDNNCISGELPVTRALVEKVLVALNDPTHTANNELFQQYLHDLRSRMTDEIGTKLVLQVPSNKMPYYDSPRVGWEKVIERFPDAVTDVEEMSRCFALSRYGATVFHSLLVVEHGLLELGRALRVSDPKPGWDATCKELKRLIDGGHSNYPSSLPVGFSVLEQVNQCIQSMKSAWRNKVSHAANYLVVIQSDFTPDITEEIVLATRSFMRRLATDLP